MHTVVIYCRASSSEQTVSCGDQLKALKAEAKKKGYKVLRDYIDDGLSGSKQIEKRVAFHQMIEDSSAREFTHILVYDSSRFGRLDALAAAQHKLTLRKNGVQGLISLGEGELLWTSSMGRMMDALTSEANHETALKISRASIRGRVEQLLERKVYPHGQIPYGYAKVYRGDGQEIRLGRDARFHKPRHWTRELVVDEAEVAVVKRIFALYTGKAQSIRQITATLNAEQAPSWDKNGWSWNSVSKVLTSKAYLGYGMIHGSKKVCKEAHNRCETIEVPGVLPAVVDQDTFELAQRLHSRSTISRFRSDKDNRTLSGIVRCGHCGYALVSKQRKREGRAGGVFYSCVGGLKYSTGCPQYQAYESDLLPSIIKELVKAVDAEVLAQLAPREEAPAADDPSAGLAKQVEKLREQVRRATLRAAAADDDMLAEYDEAARELKGQLRAAEERLRVTKHVQQEGGPALWTEWWREVRPDVIGAANDPALATELTEAIFREYPALRSVPTGGTVTEYLARARETLSRLAKDGNTDPLATLLPDLLGERTTGTVVDSNTLKATLRRMGCEVSVWWRTAERKRRNEPLHVLDKAKLVISWSGHSAPSSRGTGDSARGTLRGS